jgi:hypothetical protein
MKGDEMKDKKWYVLGILNPENPKQIIYSNSYAGMVYGWDEIQEDFEMAEGYAEIREYKIGNNWLGNVIKCKVEPTFWDKSLELIKKMEGE